MKYYLVVSNGFEEIETELKANDLENAVVVRVQARQEERVMTREKIIERVAEWFKVKPNERGVYDPMSYDWVTGCYMNEDKWLCLNEVVKLIESIMEECEDGYSY